MSSRPFARPLPALRTRTGGVVEARWRMHVPVKQAPPMRSSPFNVLQRTQPSPTSCHNTIPSLRRHFSQIVPAQRQAQGHLNQQSKMASGNVLQEWFPNTKLPIIISAPMLGASNGTLAAQVSKAGGLGNLYPTMALSYQTGELTFWFRNCPWRLRLHCGVDSTLRSCQGAGNRAVDPESDGHVAYARAFRRGFSDEP